MRKILGLVAALGGLSLAGGAQSATTLPLEMGNLESDGAYYSEWARVVLPPSGQPYLYVVFTWSSGDLKGASVAGFHETTFGYYDPWAMGGVGYNESEWNLDCSFANGCVQASGDRRAYARLVLPKEIDEPCGPPLDSLCYQRLNFSDLEASLNIQTWNGEFVTASVTFQDHAPVPEPATWAMMIGGFGLTGAALRRRRRVAAAA